MEGQCKHFRFLRVFIVFIGLLFSSLYLFLGLRFPSSADAAYYPTLDIPTIQLSTPVAPVELKDHQLTTPNLIAGSFSQNRYKTLLIGHSSTVFQQLHLLNLDDTFTYDGQTYRITAITTVEKSQISMFEILAPANTPTIILMTCAGTALPNQDATHRLIITAEIIPYAPEL